MKGLFIPEITAEMFRNGCLESIEALMADGEIYDIEYSPDFEQSLKNDVPTVEPTTKPMVEVKFDKEQLQEIVDKAKAEVLASVERPQGEWIPVSEGLPNTLGVYNVTRKLKEGETIYFISDASYFDGQNTWHRDTGINHGRPYLTDVIAWMPRPEPYKKEGAE